MKIYRVSNSFEIDALDFSAHLNTVEVQVFNETEDVSTEVQLEFTEAPSSGLSSLIICFS